MIRTSRTVRSYARPRFSLLVVACGLALAFPGGAQDKSAATNLRNLTGQVTDGHEPLHGAVVQLQNPASNSIVTYLCDPDGSYHFNRLDGSVDFNIWAEYRGHRSATHAISKFDSHMDKVIDLKIKMY